MKRAVLFALLFSMMGVTARGANLTTKDLVDDYLEYEPMPPEETFLINTTAYCHGEICCKGAKPRDGIIAAAPEWYGMAAIIYTAEKSRYNGYVPGEMIGIFEILDTGYGKSTGDGVQSKVRKDKKSRGTIEVGQCIDVYKPSYSQAKEWMELTGGKCFIQIIEGVKG